MKQTAKAAISLPASPLSATDAARYVDASRRLPETAAEVQLAAYALALLVEEPLDGEGR